MLLQKHQKDINKHLKMPKKHYKINNNIKMIFIIYSLLFNK
jgi:hypothetical protein